MATPPKYVPFRPKRIYADPDPHGKGWNYSDHSRYFRSFLRALYKKGEQLWDNDILNNLYFTEIWWGMFAIWRRGMKTGQQALWYSPYLNRTVLDPKHNNVDPGGATANTIYHWYKGIESEGGAYYYKPVMGSFCFVQGDRMLVQYGGSHGWQAVERLNDKHMNCEIAVFIQAGKKGIVARKIVSQPFMIPAKRNGSRARGVQITRPWYLRKNGVRFAVAAQSNYSCTVTVSQDTYFAEGDVLSIETNDHPTDPRISAQVSFSILGTFL